MFYPRQCTPAEEICQAASPRAQMAPRTAVRTGSPTGAFIPQMNPRELSAPSSVSANQEILALEQVRTLTLEEAQLCRVYHAPHGQELVELERVRWRACH
jgi:hypothetical protein